MGIASTRTIDTCRSCGTTYRSLESQQNNEALESELGLNELVGALINMGRVKAPRPDGLPVEYYLTYKQALLPKLLETLTEVRDRGDPPHSVMEAMIAMLPKPDREQTDPGSYRPLSSMGVDKKIFLKP